jgi:phosphoesterase RecJ-like protein
MFKSLNDKDFSKEFKEIRDLIAKSNQITITAHENPDGDSIGSCLAMRDYLSSKGKTVKILYYNSIPDTFQFMDDSYSIKIYEESDESYILTSDLVFILDVNSLARIRTVGELIAKSSAKKIMIDHHINPESFCDIYVSDHESASTGELIAKFLLDDKEYELSDKAARCIYTSILTDTGGFRFQSVRPSTHIILSELIKKKVSPNEIYDSIYNQTKHAVFVLMGRAFANSELFYDGKLNIMRVNKSDMLELGLSSEDLNNFSESTLHVKGVLAGVLISDVPDEEFVKLSFRSKLDIDVRSIAIQYGGGGHLNAAGAKTKSDDIDKLKLEIIDKFKSIFI